MIKNAKKFLLFSIIGTSLSFSYGSIVDLIKKDTKLEVEILKEQELNQDKNLKFVIVRDKKSGYRSLLLTNKQENFVLGVSSVAFMENKDDKEFLLSSYRGLQNYNKNLESNEAVKNVIKSIPSDYIIDLKGKSDKKTFWIISDPLCPHCQAELRNIDDRLKEGNVKMIAIGWLQTQSAYKAEEIHNLMKTAKNDQDKISILNKIYDTKYKSKEIDTSKIDTLTRDITGKGKVEGVPFVIEEDNY